MTEHEIIKLQAELSVLKERENLAVEAFNTIMAKLKDRFIPVEQENLTLRAQVQKAEELLKKAQLLLDDTKTGDHTFARIDAYFADKQKPG